MMPLVIILQRLINNQDNFEQHLRMTITDAAATVGLSRRHTYKWIRRFVQEGLEGLIDKPGRGHRIERLPPSLREQPNNLDRG